MDTPARTGYSRRVPRIDIPVPGIPQPLASYTAATRAGDLVFAAGHLASDFKQGVAPEARIDPAFPFYGSSIKKQTRYVLENLARTFEAAGTSLSHVVKAQVFLTDLAHFDGFDEVWREFFPTPPPRTTIGTSGLLVPGCLVEVDLTATMPRAAARVVKSDGPRPLANYSEAVVAGDLVFAAGQLASDFKTGVPREARVDPAFPYYGSDIKRQTRYILENLARTFAAAGTSLDRVVKAQVFHTDLNNFFAFDEVWREFFPTPPPRTTIGTTGLLVKDTLVEIDLIAAAVGEAADDLGVGHPPAARALHAGDARRRSRVRGGPDRERLQDRGAARSARGPRVSVLRIRRQAPDALRAGESREDVQGRRHLARPGREGAGVPHGPGELRGLRRGMA
jgi:enamine deaminase RidA (YjgF/YER057c/UK114 family)